MEDKIKNAFSEIKADDALIRRTKASLRRKSLDYGRNVYAMKQRRLRWVASVLLLVLVIGGIGIYNLPTACIDIDVNPSIELKINAFEKVVCVKGMNEDGKAVIEQLELKNLPYTKAMRQILLSKGMEQYLNEDSVLSITVVGSTLGTEDEIYRKAVCCANSVAGEENTYYCKADPETAQAARAEGLTVARYRAMLELQKTKPDVTADDVLQMNMREIKELIGCEKLDTEC